MKKEFNFSDFVKETYNRIFKSGSPYYFRLVRKIVVIGGILIGIPAALIAFKLQYEIDLPQWVIAYGKVCFTVGAILSYVGNYVQTFLTTKSVDPEKMPLTDPRPETE